MSTFLFHRLERSVLDRRGRGDAGVGDDDVEAAERERRFRETLRHRRLARDVQRYAANDVLAESLGEARDRFVERALVDVGDDDAGALAHHPRRRRAADAAGAAGDQRDAPSERLGLWHTLQLGFLEQPIFDVERFLLGEAHISADAGGAAHDVDRVDVEFAGDARGRLVLGEGQHADAGNQIDHRVGVAHRGRIRTLAALVIGGVLVAIIRELLVQARERRRRDCWRRDRRAARADGFSSAGNGRGRTCRAARDRRGRSN